MATGATTNFQIPLFGDTDFVTPIQTPLNAQSNALDTALTKSAYLTYPTYAALSAVPGTIAGQHASVNADPTASLNGDYVWTPGSPGSWTPAPLALPALFSVRPASAYTINSNWNLLTSWATPDFNRNFSFAAGVLTIQQPGVYEVITCFSTSASGINSGQITKNSSVANTGTFLRVQQSGLTAFGSVPVALVAGDQLRMFGAGPTPSQTISTDATFFAAKYISAR